MTLITFTLILFYYLSLAFCVNITDDSSGFTCAPNFELRWQGGTAPYTAAVQFDCILKSTGNGNSTGTKSTVNNASSTIAIPSGLNSIKCTVIDNNGENDVLTLHVLYRFDAHPGSNAAQCGGTGDTGNNTGTGGASGTSNPPTVSTVSSTNDNNSIQRSPDHSTGASNSASITITTTAIDHGRTTVASPLPSLPPNQNPQSNPQGNRISPGAVAGAVVGSVALIVLFTVIGLLIYRRRAAAAKNKVELQRVEPFYPGDSPMLATPSTTRSRLTGMSSSSTFPNEKSARRHVHWQNRDTRSSLPASLSTRSASTTTTSMAPRSPPTATGDHFQVPQVPPAALILDRHDSNASRVEVQNQPQSENDGGQGPTLSMETVPANWEEERTVLRTQVGLLMSVNAQLAGLTPPSYSESRH
ncbi:hypothetical protein D9758_012563 [Tetrapyrgos nigripes]|uniref:Uncharacterized protein n=1 Tax=Tetrapyrgos nigripes TaxID=182062 RepID=A0A8H5CI87_9AGAR|nr:hypothetical protein D9758_012563 [Tetrapyrgos nigripes]